MAGREIPPDILQKLAQYIRHARMARRLSIEEAAQVIAIDPSKLEALERGEGPATDVMIQVIISRLGDVRGAAVDKVLLDWTFAEMDRESKIERRKHLSIVGTNPRPWERRKS